jgi:hypothetical protein
MSLEECTCHVCPPCDFCLSLDEDEADAMANGGASAVRELRRKRVEKTLELVPEAPLPAKYRTIHCCLDVRGYLSNPRLLRQLVGHMSVNGKKLATKDEVREALFDELARGHEVLPLDEPCEGFDFKNGCHGHEEEKE